MNDCNGFFNDYAYSYLVTCHCRFAIFTMETITETTTETTTEKKKKKFATMPTCDELYYLCCTYKFNVVKEYEDILK